MWPATQKPSKGELCNIQFCKSGVAAYILSLFYLAHEPEKILLLKFLNGFAGWSTMDLSGLSKRFIRRPG
jgi:hypothetical protein